MFILAKSHYASDMYVFYFLYVSTPDSNSINSESCFEIIVIVYSCVKLSNRLNLTEFVDSYFFK